MEELVQKPVRLEQLALLRESLQLETALHAVPVQELVQGQTLSQELSLDVLLVEQLEDHLEVKKKVVAVLYPRCEERNRMLEFDLKTPDARNTVERRLPSIPRECQGSYPDLKYNTFFICQLTRT